MINKNDIRILEVLLQNECLSPIKSLKANEISAITKLSVSKVRITINLLKNLGYVDSGNSDGRAGTCFITPKGIRYLESVKNQ